MAPSNYRKKSPVLRERMDFGTPPAVHYKGDPEPPKTDAWSLMHKVWENGHEEFYFINEPPYYVKPSGSAKELWETLIKFNHPQPVSENSEWGDGLPPLFRDAYFGLRK